MAGPVWRMVVDLADIRHGRWISDTGTSGWPGSPHYKDQHELWKSGEYVPMVSDWDDIRRTDVGPWSCSRSKEDSLKGLLASCLLACAMGCSGSVADPPYFDWCAADAPPDDACYAAKRDPLSTNVTLAREIALKQMEEHPADKVIWNWEESVMMLGISELYRVTGDTAFRDYYRDWIDHHIDKGYFMGTSDSCSPAALAALLYRELGDAKYLTVVEDALHYLAEVASRTEEGGISHLGDAPVVTLWVDSLFMFGNVLMKHGELADDPDAIREFSDQFAIFTDLLQSDTGFYRHAHAWPGQDDDVYWGRGNGWVAAAGAEYLRVLRDRGETDGVAEAAVGLLMDDVKAAQDPQTGLWWTVLNRPGETYLETSATALFSYALSRLYRYGHADDTALRVIADAMDGIRSRIARDDQDRPVIEGVSGPTGVGSFANYAAVKTIDDVPFGIGVVILALVESSGLPGPLIVDR